MSDIQEEQKRLYKRAEENDIDTYKMYRKIQEQAKVYEEYDNFDREDLIYELVEEKRINEKNLEEINRLTAESTHYESKYYNEAKKVDKAIEYINTHSEMTDIQIYGIENVLAFRGSLEKLLNILQGSDRE